MAKWASEAMLDAGLDVIATSVQMSLCAGQPTTYTEATVTNMLGIETMAPGDFAKGAGTPSGREVAVATKAGVSVTNTGTGDHIALVDGTDLLYITTTPATGVTAAGTTNISQWTATIQDPV